VILIATGSEVQLAVAARETLAAEGIQARVVSAPSLEWFAEQDAAYRESVLPAAVKARVSVEAGSTRSGAASSATPAARSASTTSAPPPTTRPCSRSSASPPMRSWKRPAQPSRRTHEHPHDPDPAARDAGVSIWLDDLSRARIDSGNLADLISTRNVSGVTTNPSIFQAAIGNQDDDSYDAPWPRSPRRPPSTPRSSRSPRPTSRRRGHLPPCSTRPAASTAACRSRSPDLAHDTDATSPRRAAVGQGRPPNALIKIPATKAGLPAITAVIAAGISVNVTLIFSLERYGEVIDAYLAGLEQARRTVTTCPASTPSPRSSSRAWTPRSTSASAFESEDAEALKSRAGLANASGLRAVREAVRRPRAQELISAGANVQRPLWASTGVKDPALPDTLYVTELVAPGTVNTMPEKTLEATFDHGVITGDTVTGAYDDAHLVFSQLAELGVDITDVTQTLEDEGVAKFIASWQDSQDGRRGARRGPGERR
jgi:transaldolase